MKYVYILKSLTTPDRHYVGGTLDLKRRFGEHNRGESPHTSKFVPWLLMTYVAFSDHKKRRARGRIDGWFLLKLRAKVRASCNGLAGVIEHLA